MLKLTTHMRAKSEGKEFAKFLLEIGNGTYSYCESDNEEEIIPLPSTVIKSTDLSQKYTERGSSSPAILAPKNKHYQETNKKVLKLLPGVCKRYRSKTD